MKKGTHFLFFALVILISSCAVHKKGNESATVNKNQSDTLLAAIERNACFGRCPEYKAIIYKSGFAEYFGRKNVTRIGHYTSKVNPETLNDIYSQIRTYKLETMDTSYINPEIADFPGWSVWVSDFKPRKHIYIMHDAPPEGIVQFGKKLDIIIDGLNWTKVSGKNDQ